MSKNPLDWEHDITVFLAPLILFFLIVGAFVWMFNGKPEPKPVVVRPPVKAQDVGKDLGSKTGRFVGGFIKGLWKQEEKK